MISKFVEILKKVCFAISGTSICVITVLISMEIIARFCFKTSLHVAEEFTEYLMVFIVYWGAVLSIDSGSFIRVEMLWDLFPRKVREFLDKVYTVIMFVFFAFLTRYTWNSVVSAYKFGLVSNGYFEIPLIYIKSFMFLAMIMLLLYLIVHFVQMCAGKEGER